MFSQQFFPSQVQRISRKLQVDELYEDQLIFGAAIQINSSLSERLEQIAGKIDCQFVTLRVARRFLSSRECCSVKCDDVGVLITASMLTAHLLIERKSSAIAASKKEAPLTLLSHRGLWCVLHENIRLIKFFNYTRNFDCEFN